MCWGESSHGYDIEIKKNIWKESFRDRIGSRIWPLEELKSAAVSLAHELASQPAQAVKSMMSVLVNSSDRELEDLLKAERQAVRDNSGTKDSQEGMIAFLEKRKPEFNK